MHGQWRPRKRGTRMGSIPVRRMGEVGVGSVNERVGCPLAYPSQSSYLVTPPCTMFLTPKASSIHIGRKCQDPCWSIEYCDGQWTQQLSATHRPSKTSLHLFLGLICLSTAHAAEHFASSASASDQLNTFKASCFELLGNDAWHLLIRNRKAGKRRSTQG
jgi:hypothetical protein